MNTSQKLWLADYILSPDNLYEEIISVIRLIRSGETFDRILKSTNTKVKASRSVEITEIGVVGNVWIRRQYYANKDCEKSGHKHHHDHVSLLAKGRLQVHVEGYDPVIYNEGDFFLIKAEHEHMLVPLEDDTIAYCIFALRNVDGEVVDDFDGITAHYDNIK